jgi:hypothetical protein
MKCRGLTIQEATIALTADMSRCNWFTAAHPIEDGHGKRIVLFVTTRTTGKLTQLIKWGYEGYQVDFEIIPKCPPAVQSTNAQ